VSQLGSKEFAEFYGNISVRADLNVTVSEKEDKSPILSQNFVFKGTATTQDTALSRLESSINNGITDAIVEMLSQ
jgi:aspartate ammonia-lyase